MAFGVLLVISTLCFAADAHPLYLFGDIGRFPVLVMIERNGSDLSGWYFYVRQAKEIRLAGKMDAHNAFTLDEFDTNTGKKTAHFTGMVGADGWTGTWQNARSAGAPLPFTLRESRDVPGDARLRCATKMIDKPSGYTFSASVDLAIARGKIGKFAIDHGAVSKYDEQDCSVDMTSLEQQPSDAGLLLHSKKSGGDLDQRCAIRIVGNDAFLYVQVGDGDADCRGGADQMFCSARGSWSDVVIERKTGTCRAVE